jgi:2'-5' RNA ligase
LNTADEKRIYAVVLTFCGDIEIALNKLRSDYQQYMGYTIVPHITLVKPFAPVFSLFRVIEQLEKVARQTRQFNITLHGIEFFENGNNVAYAAIEKKRAVKKLHTDIIRSLDGLIKEWYTDGQYNLEKFVPHVTIGERIPAALFPDIKKRLSKYRLHYQDNVTEFGLFSEENGAWQLNRVFQLAGNTKENMIEKG